MIALRSSRGMGRLSKVSYARFMPIRLSFRSRSILKSEAMRAEGRRVQIHPLGGMASFAELLMRCMIWLLTLQDRYSVREGGTTKMSRKRVHVMMHLPRGGELSSSYEVQHIKYIAYLITLDKIPMFAKNPEISTVLMLCLLFCCTNLSVGSISSLIEIVVPPISFIACTARYFLTPFWISWKVLLWFWGASMSLWTLPPLGMGKVNNLYFIQVLIPKSR
mmetsp:Transcript_31076/g.63118  ORF Transcript_31076/g.63118 Transcript_31076/m.63118 type:complete len:220 (+) Transcript_31076:1317-1976(+)